MTSIPSATAASPASAALDAPRPGDLAQHYKGGLYRIEALVTDEATAAPALVYRPLADPQRRAWVRLLSVFVEPVTGLDGRPRRRFEPVPLPDESALRAACAACGLLGPLVDEAVARYREPGRHYHASWHVNDLFARAADAGIVLSRAQVLAILFHDAVYVPGAPAGTNEALSALLMEQATHGRPEVPEADLALAATIIRDTAGHRASVAESAPVLALDLATLADDPVRFDTWTELVWLEYRHLFRAEADPRAAFMQRRVRVLRGLLESSAGQAMLPGFFERFGGNVERLAVAVGPMTPAT